MKRLILSSVIVASALAAACGQSKPAPSFAPRSEPAVEEKAPASEQAKPAAPAVETTAAAPQATAPVEMKAVPPAAVPSAPQGGVTVTRIQKEADGMAITLNDAIVIHGVEVKSGANGKFLAFPERKTPDGKFFPYVRLSREDGDRLAAMVESNKTEQGPKGFSITAVSVKMMERAEGKRKAFVEFELNGGAIKLSSWTIIDSEKGTFIAGPSDKVGSEYKDLVHSANKDFYEKLKAAALAEFAKQGGVVTPSTGR